MTEEAKRIVAALRNSYGYSERRDAEAADMIESLSKQLDNQNEAIDRIYDMCKTLQSDLKELGFDSIAEMRDQLEQVTMERDAAVEDINEAAKTGCLCYVCKSNNEGHCGAFDRRIFESVVMCGQYKWRGVEVKGCRL